MNAVLYTDQMEAITVIDLPMWGIDRLKHREFFFVAVIEPVKCVSDNAPPDMTPMRIVRIWGEQFIRKGQSHWLLFTDDDEAALLLRAEPLPGQRKLIQETFQLGFINGLITALRALGD